LEQLITDFETVNPKRKYRSDLDVFIRESYLEDFYRRDSETIFISTIHKAKGREFDNLFLMLDGLENALTEQKKRELYVAITRAKQNLTIHLNSGHFDHIHTTTMHRTEITGQNPPTDQISMHLTHKDVWLDFCFRTQYEISSLIAGDDLIVKTDECLNQAGKSILKFSKSFLSEIEKKQSKGYKLTGAKVNFILYWQRGNSKQEIQIVLPKVCFEKVLK
jgi:ATP-dependent DNA helicase RecQ